MVRYLVGEGETRARLQRMNSRYAHRDRERGGGGRVHAWC